MIGVSGWRLICALLSVFCASSPKALAADRPIRAVDFGNATIPWELRPDIPGEWEWLPIIPTGQVQLQGGRAVPGEGDYVALEQTVYADLTGDGHDEAIVQMRYGTGGTANWSYLYVFTERSGRAECIAVMRAGSRAYGGLVKLLVRDRKLELHFLDASLRQGDCCSNGAIVAKYQWNGKTFVETGRRRSYPLEQKTAP